MTVLLWPQSPLCKLRCGVSCAAVCGRQVAVNEVMDMFFLISRRPTFEGLT